MSIICKNGATRISGSTVDILQDLTNIIHSARLALSEHLGQSAADELIAICGRMAYGIGEESEEDRLSLLEEISSIIDGND